MKRDVEQGLLDRENKLAERHQGEKRNGRELNDAAAAADGYASVQVTFGGSCFCRS